MGGEEILVQLEPDGVIGLEPIGEVGVIARHHLFHRRRQTLAIDLDRGRVVASSVSKIWTVSSSRKRRDRTLASSSSR